MQQSQSPGVIPPYCWRPVSGLADSVQHPGRGSAVALPFIAALSLAEVPFFIEVQLWLTLCCIGVPICTIASRQLGGQKDPSSIILDEFAAMPLVLLVVPSQQRTWLVMLIAFLLFRLFDITKPPPCRQLENFPDGLGIMADDWAAAGLAACTLFVIITLMHAYY